MSATVLPPLSVQLIAKLDQFEANMNKAGRLGERNVALIESKFAALGSTATRVAGALGVAFSVGQLNAFFRSTVNGLDALNDLRDATGATIENISALEDIGARTGNTFETVSATLVKFNKVLSDAKPGSETAAWLKAIGLNAEELKRLDPAEALRQFAVALSGWADDGKKARVVQELLGKGLREMAPYLNDLATQTRLVGTVTSEQTAAAEKFNQQLAQLEKNSTDAARALASDLVPALNTFFVRLKGLKDAGGWGGFFGSIGKELSAVSTSNDIADVVDKIELVQKRLAFGNADEKPGLTRQLAALRVEFARLMAEADGTSAALRKYADIANPLASAAADPNGAGGGRGSVNPAQVLPSISEPESQVFLRMKAAFDERGRIARQELATGQSLNESERFRADGLRQVNDATLQVTDSERKRLRAAVDMNAGAIRLNERTREQVQAILAEARALATEGQARQQSNKTLAEQIEEIGLSKDELDALTIKRLEQAAALEEERIATLELFDAQAANLGQMRLNAAELRKNIELRRQAQSKDDAQGRDPLKGASDAIDAYLKQISKTGDATREAVSSSLGTLENDLSTGLAKGQVSIASFVDAAIVELYRLTVVRPFLRSIFGGANGGGLNWSDLFADLTGSTTYGGAGTGAANVIGDYAMSAGPAAFRNRAGAMSAGGTIVIDNSGQVINVGSGVSRAEVQAAIDSSQARSDANLRRSLRQAKVL